MSPNNSITQTRENTHYNLGANSDIDTKGFSGAVRPPLYVPNQL